MPRLAILSDTHNEFERATGPRQPTHAWFTLDRARRAIPGHPATGPLLDSLRGRVDLAVLAGDIDIGHHSIVYAEQVAEFLAVPVVLVMGNHEAYGGRDLDLLVPEMQAAARGTAKRVNFLENASVRFDFEGRAVHVLGCCLFTDYAVNGGGDVDLAYAMRDAAASLNDHARIVDGGRLFTPDMARRRHAVSRAWLGDEIASIRAGEADATLVVVTHHAPIPDANPPEYRGGRLAPAFVSDLRPEIEAWQPDIWIWGHTHYSMDRTAGCTRLVSAQRGYVCVESGADEFVPVIVEI